MTTVDSNLHGENPVIAWLLSGDPSIVYQVHKDLLNVVREDLRSRISGPGWGKRFLAARNPDGHWGRGFYQPKWTSTHYTLLDLRNLEISPEILPVKQTVSLVFKTRKCGDGGINPAKTIQNSDVCINGMFLNYASYFGASEEDLRSVVDFLLSEKMPDGGFNCHSNRQGAVHSSLHTTLSVLEGILEYSRNGYRYRISELKEAERNSIDFLLQHRLFRSDRTGKIIDPRMLRLSYPSRWRYDILRALDYFQSAGVHYDGRMEEAIYILLKKQRSDGKWPLQARHPGKSHFEMEVPGEASRWNTLRALRVFKHFDAVSLMNSAVSDAFK